MAKCGVTPHLCDVVDLSLRLLGGISHTVFHSGHTSLPYYKVHKGSLFFTSLLTHVICLLFDDSHSDLCEVPHCVVLNIITCVCVYVCVCTA